MKLFWKLTRLTLIPIGLLLGMALVICAGGIVAHLLARALMLGWRLA